MNRRDALFALLAPLVSSIARAQQAETIYRVVMIFMTSSEADIAGPEAAIPGVRTFVRSLRALGYVEGRNLVLDRLSAEKRRERIPEVVAEALRRKPDVIIATGSEIALAAKRATSTIPIVMTNVTRPVKSGLVASLARPGGNVTGLALAVTPESEGKRLELLKDLVPQLARVSCLATKWSWDGPIGRAVRQAAPGLGIDLIYAEHRPDDLAATFANIARQQPDGLIVALSPDVYAQQQQIADFARRARLPGIFPLAEMVQAGGLMSYGVNVPDLFHRAASYVDRILKGAKPSELPVEQPAAFELVINLKTAKELGLTFSKELLFRASQVIE